MADFEHPQIISGDSLYEDLLYIDDRVGEGNLYFNYEAFLDNLPANVLASKQANSPSYAFIATYPEDSDRWCEVYSCSLYREKQLAELAIYRGASVEFTNSKQAQLWGEYQVEAGLLVPNSAEKRLFGTLIRQYKNLYQIM